MEVDVDQLLALASIVKYAAEEEEQKEPVKKKPPRRRKRYTAAFPHYRRSLVEQYKQKPVVAGLKRGVGSGAIGAILGALIGKLTAGTGKATLGGAAAGGLLGAGVGVYSGAQDAKSDHSRLLSLRRAGIETPGELEMLMRHPELLKAKGLTDKGVRL